MEKSFQTGLELRANGRTTKHEFDDIAVYLFVPFLTLYMLFVAFECNNVENENLKTVKNSVLLHILANNKLKQFAFVCLCNTVTPFEIQINVIHFT